MHELNRNRNNPNLFFSQIRRVVQYKIKNKVVSKLKSKDNKILNIKESMQLALNFFSELYSGNDHTKPYCTNQLDYSFYIDKAWDRLSLRKATGIDLIPGEWIIKGLKFPSFKEVITKCFEVCITTWTIPDFWAPARLILLNKNKNGDIPTIEETRPIANFPSIMKLFENSLIHHLENLVIDNKLSKNQRGFVEGGETYMNITEVISFGNDLKAQKIKGLFLFIDLRKAYDWVDRSVLLKKCSRKGLPSNFIDLLCNIFSKTKVTLDGSNYISTKRGLLQGSWLSPLLFNIYINDLIEELEKKFFTKAYADDLVIGLLCQVDLHKCLWILQRWSHNNNIEINPNKSGLLRVLRRKGKILEIKKCS